MRTAALLALIFGLYVLAGTLEHDTEVALAAERAGTTTIAQGAQQ